MNQSSRFPNPTPPTPEPTPSRIQRLAQNARRYYPFTAGVFATILALLLYNRFVPATPPITQQDVNDTIAEVLASATAPPAFSARVYQSVQPSLVLIQSHFPEASPGHEFGLGSGVIVSAQGDILTSLHVVDGASEIFLTFADGTQAEAEIVAAQPEIDIAVLAPSQLPAQFIPATLGNPNAMRVGDEAFAMGNPFGLYGSMSAGVISGFDRSFQPVNMSQPLEDLIQIDAAVNPGNSGGPLLNREGHVVGIVVGIVNPTESEFFVGIGFAVPIQVAASAAGSPPH